MMHIDFALNYLDDKHLFFLYKECDQSKYIAH